MKLCVFIYTVEWKPSRWWFNAFPSPQKVLLCYFLSIPSRSNPYCYFYSQWLVLHVFKYVWNFHFTFINSVAVVVAAQSLYHVWLFVTPWTVAHQAPLSVGFPRQEHWSALPFPSLGNLPHRPRDKTHISWIGRPMLYHWATREALSPF